MGRSLLAASPRREGRGAPVGWPQMAASQSTLRVSIAVVLLMCLGWAAIHVSRDDSAAASSPSAGTPADRRQREILEQAIDQRPDPALAGIYDEINARHFNGRLPAIPVVWEPRLAEVGTLAAKAFTLEGMFGNLGDKSIILLNPRLSRKPDALRRALSYEMVHAWLHTVGDPSTGHGPAFQATLERLSNEGAFAGIVAGLREREALRTWLESESIRLDAMNDDARRESEALGLEAREIKRSLADMNTRRRDGAAVGEPEVAAWILRRNAYNHRVSELRNRAERARTDAAAFNDQVERYNLMLSYPDGLDEQEPFASRR